MQVLKALSEVSTIIAGQSPPSDTYNTIGDGLPFFQGKTDFGDLYPKIRVFCSYPQKIAEKNDILLSVRAPVGPTNLAPSKICIGRGLAAIRAGEKLNQKYLLFFFRSIEKVLSDSGTGTTFKAITQEQIRNIRIPLPPLPEQERIVARIEELFSDLDKGVEALQTIKAQLKVFRQAVLKEAFEPKSGWVLKPSAEIGEVNLGRQRSPKNVSNNYPTKYIRAANITEQGLDLSDLLEMEFTPSERQKYTLVQGDIVLSEASGSIRQVGKPAIWKNEIEGCCFQNTVIRHRVNGANPQYIFWYYKYCYVSGLFSKIVGGVGINHIGAKNFSELVVPLAPREEQNRLVTEIESRLSVCDKIEQTVDESLAKAESMRQSILKKAFEGRLI